MSASLRDGCFGLGLPRINDGALLFLLHMIAKRKPSPEGGGEGPKIAIVFNGSPLFFDPRKPSRLAEYAKGASLHLKFVVTDHFH
jgi:hypothetical protein